MSISTQDIEITNRFFHAIEILKSQGKVKSLRQITIMYGMNYGNTYTIKKHPELARINASSIANLCMDFGISTEWMLLGYGQMFIKRRVS